VSSVVYTLLNSQHTLELSWFLSALILSINWSGSSSMLPCLGATTFLGVYKEYQFHLTFKHNWRASPVQAKNYTQQAKNYVRIIYPWYATSKHFDVPFTTEEIKKTLSPSPVFSRNHRCVPTCFRPFKRPKSAKHVLHPPRGLNFSTFEMNHNM
jgi:hypothetical protein